MDTSPFMILVDTYTMDRQCCPRERPLGKTREVGLEGSEGSFQVKDALERPLDPCNPPLWVFPRGLSLGQH